MNEGGLDAATGDTAEGHGQGAGKDIEVDDEGEEADTTRIVLDP